MFEKSINTLIDWFDCTRFVFLFVHKTGRPYHRVEVAVGLGKQLVGRVEFDNATLVEYHDARAVQYGVESMRYCDNGALAEGALERLLYQAVGVVVDRGGRFVQHEYFSAALGPDTWADAGQRSDSRRPPSTRTSTGHPGSARTLWGWLARARSKSRRPWMPRTDPNWCATDQRTRWAPFKWNMYI